MKAPKLSPWIKSGAFSIGSRLSVLIFGFGSFYFLVRLLPKAQFGAWSIFLTITTIVEMSRNGLIQNALIKLLHSHDESETNKVVTGSWFINVAYSLLIFVCLVLLAGLFGKTFGVDGFQSMFIFYGITLAILIPFSQFNYMQQARFSFNGIFWSAATRQGLFFVSIIVIYSLRFVPSLTQLVLIQSGCTLVGLVVAFISARRYIHFQWEFDWDMSRKIFHFGKFVMGTNISSLLFKSVDQFAIGAFLTPNNVASYASAMRLSNLIEYPATSVSEVVYPHSTKRISEQGEQIVKSLYEKSVALTMAITVPIVAGTFIFSDFIIYIIAGPEYADSAGILRVTILFGLLTPFMRQFGMVMDSSGRPHLNFVMLLFALAFNIGANWIMVPAFGVMGAAFGTLLSYVVFSIVGHIILVRLFDVNVLNILSYTLSFYQKAISVGWDLAATKLKLQKRSSR